MKANEAPEKLYIDSREHWMKSWTAFTTKAKGDDIEYTRTGAFIEKALKWYCLDCECNDNCKDTKCFFYREYERYLKGETNAAPPKFSDSIINEDGSVSEKYCYRHFINRVQEAFIEKAAKFLKYRVNIPYDIKTNEKGEPYADSYIDYAEKRLEAENKFIEKFKNYMRQ